MTAPASVEAIRARAGRRAACDVALVALPPACVLALLAWRFSGAVAALLAVVLAAAVAGVVVHRRLRRHDHRWLASRLDDARADLDDSSALLFAREETLGPLQRLQRARIVERLQARPAPELSPPWSRRAIAAAWLSSVAIVLALFLWPRSAVQSAGRDDAPSRAAAVSAEPHLVAATLRVQPPAYTGIAATQGESLDAKAPAGTRLRWTLRYAPQPAGVALVFHDGRRIELRREGGAWIADTVLQASALYRVVPEGVADAASSPLHRLDAVPDQPPRIRVLAPERSLTLLAPGQREWRLAFEATDDHGVSAQARLQVTRTEGTGENIRFHDHTIALRGTGDARARRFEARLSPSSYGLQRGEDLVARLEVLDNRAPQPQQARSSGVILRWPAEPVVGAEGLEGLARQVLPAYFRSQRQIIIDAEALLKEKPRPAQDEFARRSDAIGVDQRLLRLRYGQFLGEESEGGRGLPTSDLPTSDAHDDDDDHDHDHDHAEDAAEAGHAHDHGQPGPPAEPAAGFGLADDLLETFGHTHDIPEAATLLDPETREILRGALREMWQSELHLRQAAPQQALPYAYRALELIKRVQQAERIYLARVGTQLPPIDEGRRLTGKREGIASRALPKLAAVRSDEALASAWRVLEAERPGADTAAVLDALQAWVDANRERVDDPLSWIERIDALRGDPGCGPCREALRALVWGSLPRPAGGVSRRAGEEAEGRRYLERLRAGEATP